MTVSVEQGAPQEFVKSVDICSDSNVVLQVKTLPLSLYQGKSNSNANPNMGMYIMSFLNCGENKIPFKCLLDSGSTMSIINYDHYLSIPEHCRPPLSSCSKQIKLADGSLRHCAGTTKIMLHISDVKCEIEFLVVSCSDAMIIGMSDMSKLQMIIEFDTCLVTVHDSWVPLLDFNSQVIGRKVCVDSDIVVPAQSEMLHHANLEGSNYTAIFSPVPVELNINEDLYSVKKF